MSTIQTEISSVDKQIMALQKKLENVPVDEISLARLERDRETAEKLYTFFAEKLEETRVQEAGVTADLKIINPAIVSGKPVNSRGRLTSLVLAIIISCLVGGAGIFIAEYFDNTVKDLELIKTKLNIPIFASIPGSDGGIPPGYGYTKHGYRYVKRRFSPKKAVKDFFDPLTGFIKRNIGAERALRKKGRYGHYEHLRIVGTDSSSAEFEGFRKLSLNIEFAHPEKNYRVIYLTSPGPEEGKTYISLNLGATMSMVGKKVVVVDTDFRKKKGHLTDVVKMKKEEGLFDILQGKSALKDAIVAFQPDQINQKNSKIPSSPTTGQKDEKNQKDQTDQKDKTDSFTFSLLPVGSVPPNPFIFLESSKMSALLEDLKKMYDFVLIDGLPMLLFADATYLARNTDAVIIVARYGRTIFKELEDTRDVLQNARANIIGLVINDVPRGRGSYYYHYYKYYSKYYKKEA